MVNPLFLGNLVVRHNLVALLGGSWECQSVSKAGRQQGLEDPRFEYVYNLIRITNYFQLEQIAPLLCLF